MFEEALYVYTGLIAAGLFIGNESIENLINKALIQF